MHTLQELTYCTKFKSHILKIFRLWETVLTKARQKTKRKREVTVKKTGSIATFRRKAYVQDAQQSADDSTKSGSVPRVANPTK